MLPAINLNKYGSTVQPGRLNSTQTAQLYYQSLHSDNGKMSNVCAADTVSRRDKAMQELHTWLQQLPADLGKTLLTCNPADILVFMESHWIQQHAGTDMHDGTCIASPAGVN